MHSSIKLIAIGAAVFATPAMAQLGVGLGGQGGVNVGVGAGANVGTDIGGTLDRVGGTMDRTVGTLDRTANGALNSSVRAATAADLAAGTSVKDNRGRHVGVLQSIHGQTAVVVSGNQMLHVPVASLYRSGKGLLTNLSRSQLDAAASANANANANAGGSVRR